MIRLGPEQAATLNITPTKPTHHLTARVGQAGQILPTVHGTTLKENNTPIPGQVIAQLGALTEDGYLMVFEQLMPGTLTTPGDQAFMTTPPAVSTGDGYINFNFTPPIPQEKWRAAYKLPDTTNPLTLTVTAEDLLAATGTTQPITLTVTLRHTDGTRTTLTYTMQLDFTPPTGQVEYELGDPVSFAVYSVPEPDATHLKVYFQDGGTQLVPITPGSSVALIEDTRTPIKITALDDVRNESPNLLTRVLQAPGVGDETLFAEWPLPRYLQKDKPNLQVFLVAFEQALDIKPDALPEQSTNFLKATSTELERIALHFGVARQPGDTDEMLRQRILDRLRPRKTSRVGMSTIISRLAGVPTSIFDDQSTVAGSRTLDGTWKLDGSVTLGGNTASTLGPGHFTVTFKAIPKIGWERITQLIERHRAAGTIPTIRYHRPPATLVAFTHPSMEINLAFKHQTPPLDFTARATKISSNLTLDGSWSLDGTQTLDGTAGASTSTEL